MSEEIFKQSLVWCLAFDSEQEKQEERQRITENTESNDIVTMDYSFLMEDDF